LGNLVDDVDPQRHRHLDSLRADPVDELRQIPAVDEALGEERFAVDFTGSESVDQVWMREPSRYGRFVIESLPVPSVLQVLGVEALHHAKPLSTSVVPKRERNFAHAAFAKRLNENVRTESLGVH
jgi:hypothetical protein